MWKGECIEKLGSEKYKELILCYNDTVRNQLAYCFQTNCNIITIIGPSPKYDFVHLVNIRTLQGAAYCGKRVVLEAVGRGSREEI